MCKTDPIKNDDKVALHVSGGGIVYAVFRDVKNNFIAGMLGYTVEKIYLPRTNTYRFVKYHTRKGFTFEKIKGEKK